jgi:CRP-like cAMP-binding protein
MGPGDFFGEIGLLGNRPRTATVTASEASQLLLMDQATFVELVRGSAPTKDQLARVMGERLAVVP